MCKKDRKTLTHLIALSGAVFVCLLATVQGAVVLAQATSNPNQIAGEIEFTNTNPAILAILNGPSDSPPGANKGFSSGSLRADSIGTSPTFNNSTGLAVTSRTTATYEVTVESSTAGIPYRVYSVDMRLDSGGDRYFFVEQNSLPVFPEPSPDVVLDFAECAGIVDVHFVDENGSPVSVDGGSIVARPQPSNTVQAQDFGLPNGTSTETLAIRGDGSNYRIDVNYLTTVGTDPFFDLIRFEGLCQEFLTMQCDEIQVIECVIPVEDGGPGPDPNGLGTILGEVDMLCEEEHPLPTLRTRMIADLGPFNNFRLDYIDPTPPSLASSGPFLLPNLPPSDAVSPSRGYRVWTQMSFDSGYDYQDYRSPFLGSGLNPRVLVDAGLTTDLGDLFVMNPGYLAADILLAGPPLGVQGSCLEDITRDADFDSNGDGIPNSISTSGHSRLEAFGVNLRATGATYTAAGGVTRTGFGGSFHLPTESFAGQGEFALAGLDQEWSIWRANRLVLRMLDTATPAVPESYQSTGMTLVQHNLPDFEIVPKETLPVDHHFCFSEVRFSFGSTAGTFFNPLLSGSGAFVGTDFEGNPANYSVGINSRGTPLTAATAANQGLVVMCAPAATYTLTPFVTSVNPGGGTSNTELPPVTFSCGCRQVCGFTSGIQIFLDPIAQCTADGNLPISGSVNSDVDVERIFYTIGGRPEVDICPGSCGIDPGFAATVPLASCDNEFTVRAVDVLGNEASVTSEVTFDAQPPVFSGCEEISVELEPGQAEVQVTYDVAATDDCSGPVSVDCDPPSGSLFSEGATEVSCTAVDACGGTNQCTFPVTVTSCQPVEPGVRTQGFWKRQCQGPHPSGEHDNLPQYLGCVADTETFAGVDDVAPLCDSLHPQPKKDKCEQAEAQFMAMMLNVCSDRVRACNCLEDQDLGTTTVGDAIDFVDALLSNPGRTFQDCVLAQGIADRINNSATLAVCAGDPAP